MVDGRFFKRTDLEKAGELAEAATKRNIIFSQTPEAGLKIASVAPLKDAGSADLSFLDNMKYQSDFSNTGAGFCVVRPKFIASAPQSCALFVTENPYSAYAVLADLMFDDIGSECFAAEAYKSYNGAFVHPDASLEEGVTLAPGVTVSARAEIGSGTKLYPNVYIGAGVTVGRDCALTAGASVTHALIGDYVRIGPGVRVGQEGFGFAPGAKHTPVPQLGRVILQDHVDLGAGTAIDRGASGDTVIGEGTKIDNLVQIGHNVRVGRHCFIAGQTAVAGSVTIEDYVSIGGQTCIAGHLTIAGRAQVAGGAAVMHNVPAGEIWAGAPAQPIRSMFKEVAILKKLAKTGGGELT